MHVGETGGRAVLPAPLGEDVGCRGLAVVGDRHAVDIVATTEGQRQHGVRAFVFEGVDTTVGIVLATDSTNGVTVLIGDGDVLTAGVCTTADTDGGVTAHTQFHGLSRTESPAVCIVVIATVADLDALMVGGVEVRICQVVGKGGLVVGNLHRCGYGIERQVTLYEILHLEFLSTSGTLEPTTEHHTEGSVHILFPVGKGADGLLALGLLCADHTTVQTVVGQGIAGVQGCDLVLRQRTHTDIGTVGHTRDGQRRGLTLVVEHIDILLVVLPTAGIVGGLRGHFLAVGVGHRDGGTTVGTLSDGDLHVRSVGHYDLQFRAAVFAVELTADGCHGTGVVGSHTADRSVVSDSNTKTHCSSLLLFVSRQQRSSLVVDDGAEVLETVCPAHHSEHQQQAHCAKSS